MSSKHDECTAGGDMNAKLAELYDLVPAYAERGDIGFYVNEARRNGGRTPVEVFLDS